MFSSADTIWVLLGTVLVFFMQAGFAMVETGFTRAKNSGNIIMKNLMDFSLGSLVFWFIGYGIMFGGDGPFIGELDFFIQRNYDSNIPTFVFVIFQTVFCATASTILSGAMAERTKFSSYCICSGILSAFIYPVSGHWIWGGGWLSELGFHDFAGSTTVHMVGGVCAIIGAKILGPRIGKFDKNNNPVAIPGHSLTLGALGVFILWFSWFGFNGASSLGISSDEDILLVANIFMTTNIAAVSATMCVMIVTWVLYKKPDVSMTLNASLAGLVAITAGCDIVTPFGAFCIGIIAGFILIFGVLFVEKTLKIDDPVGAIPVHGMCGAIGTILTGVFAVDGGLLYGGGFSLLGVQILGVVAVIVWVSVTITIVFLSVKSVMGLRVSEEEEVVGLDIKEHGLESSYADFLQVSNNLNTASSNTASNNITKEISIPVTNSSSQNSEIKKLVIITKESKFEVLKNVLDNLGITGMTVTKILGYGMQKGDTKFYRGTAVETKLLPKVKVEIVVCNIPLEPLIQEVRNTLFTGNIGDGKIFVYDVCNVVKIRTGEEGVQALLDEE